MAKNSIEQMINEYFALSDKFIREHLDNHNIDDLMADVTISQGSYIQRVGEMGNPTLSELAERMGYSKPSVTIAIAKLEKKGYLERVQSSDDRRSFHIHLTEKGKSFFAKADRIKSEMKERIKSSLTEKEMVQFLSLSRKIFEK